MTYTKKQFLEDVKKEARALKKHATPNELSKLNFNNLDARNFNRCVYGQMTNNCFSERAAILIHNCCPRYFNSINEDRVTLEEFSAEEGDVRKYVNGCSIKGVATPEDLKEHRDGSEIHYSSIEAYIMQPNAKNANLIAFLKGERKDLVL